MSVESLHFPLTSDAEQAASNVESEAGLLGALLLDNSKIDLAADVLAAEDFSEQFYGHVFGLITSEHGQGRAVNVLTLRNQLGEEGFKAVAGLTTSDVVRLVDVRHTAADLAYLAGRRRLAAALTAAAR